MGLKCLRCFFLRRTSNILWIYEVLSMIFVTFISIFYLGGFLKYSDFILMKEQNILAYKREILYINLFLITIYLVIEDISTKDDLLYLVWDGIHKKALHIISYILEILQFIQYILGMICIEFFVTKALNIETFIPYFYLLMIAGILFAGKLFFSILEKRIFSYILLFFYTISIYLFRYEVLYRKFFIGFYYSLERENYSLLISWEKQLIILVGIYGCLLFLFLKKEEKNKN